MTILAQTYNIASHWFTPTRFPYKLNQYILAFIRHSSTELSLTTENCIVVCGCCGNKKEYYCTLVLERIFRLTFPVLQFMELLTYLFNKVMYNVYPTFLASDVLFNAKITEDRYG